MYVEKCMDVYERGSDVLSSYLKDRKKAGDRRKEVAILMKINKYQTVN